MEYGQPLHAFDYDITCANPCSLRNRRRDIRWLLDGEERTLENEIVITQAASQPH